MILFKKILFSILLILIWYYLLKPFIANYDAFRSNAKTIEKNNSYLFTPKSGRGVLPNEVQLTLFAIDSMHLKDYKLYGALAEYRDSLINGIEIYQRINESAWPVKMDTLSHNLIGYSPELAADLDVKIVLQINNSISVGTY